MKKYVLGVVFLAVASFPVAAATVAIGQLQLMDGVPNFGQQTVGVFNYTGSAPTVPEDYCNQPLGLSAPSVCTALNIFDWTMVINYTDLSGAHTSTFGLNSTDPIGPATAYAAFTGTVGAQWTFDHPCADTCPPTAFDVVIDSVVFSGSIGTGSPVPLTITDGVGGYTTFFASPTFTTTYTPVVIDAGAGLVFFNAVDILVNDADTGGPGPGPGSSTPEPSTLSFILIGAGAVTAGRSFRRNGRNIANS